MKRTLMGLATWITKHPGGRSRNPAWPSLNHVACVRGRSATKRDVDAGRAVFVLGDENAPVGRPIEIAIPQYAYHIVAESDEKVPCVVIQAEEVRGQKLVGCRKLDGESLAGFFAEFVLLGEQPPGAP